MFPDLPAQRVFGLLAAALLSAFGAWMILRRPLHPETRAAGAYATSLGLAWLTWLLLYAMGGELTEAQRPVVIGIGSVSAIANLAAFVAVIALAFRYAAATPGYRGRLLVFPLVIGVVAGVHALASWWPETWSNDAAWAQLEPWVADMVNVITWAPVVGAFWFAVAIAAIGLHLGGPNPAMGRQLALAAAVSPQLFLGVGTGISVAARQGLDIFVIPGTQLPSYRWTEGLLAIATLAALLAAIGRDWKRPVAPGLAVIHGWILLWFLLGTALLGMLMEGSVIRPLLTDPGGVFAALATLLSVAILAYAVLRHQMFALDVKLRWTISKTTLAGIFVAAFFVGGEAAQQFFGERFGGPYIGILAAGALVFAISPMTRLADRVAAHAVPTNDPSPSQSTPQEDAYRDAVLRALQDNVLSRTEERSLLRLASHLGISAAKAASIHEEVEAQAGSTPASGGASAKPRATATRKARRR